MTKNTESAGGVVMNPEGQIVVVSNYGQTWTLPKGHLEEGEDTLTAAKREVHEETGISDLELVRELGFFERYRGGRNGGYDTSERKRVTIFFFRTSSMTLAPFGSDISEARFVPKEDVSALLSYKEDRDFFISILGEI